MARKSKQIKTVDELARELRKAYFNQWRKNNPERVKKHNEDYWRNLALKTRQEEEAAQNDAKTDD